MAGTLTPELKKYDTPEQFEQDAGYKPKPDIWRPINVAPIRLQELKGELSSLPDGDKAERAKKFIDANKAEGITVPVAALAGATAAGGALATEAAEGLSKAVGEGVEALGKEAEAIKKNPIRKMAEFFGFSDSSIVSDLKEALTEKKSGGFDGFFAGMKVWFYGFLAKAFGMDLAKHLTPEEMKLAGVKGKTDGEVEKKQEKISDKYTGSRYIFQGLFLNEAQLPITDMLSHEKFKTSNIKELGEVYTSGKYSEYLSKIGKTSNESNIQALTKILGVIFAGKSSEYIREAYNSTKKLPKATMIPMDATFGEYIISASAILKSMKGLAKAGVTQKMQEPSIAQDSDGNIKIKDGGEESEYIALIDGDKKLLSFMLGTNATGKYTIGKRDEFHKDLNNDSQFKALYTTPEEKNKATATINKILDFTDSFMQTIQSNSDINLGMGRELGGVIHGKALNLKGLMLIYLSMQGKSLSGFNDFSTIEQAQVYTIVTTIFNISDSKVANGENTAKYLEALNNSTSPIPMRVKEFMSDTTKYIAEKSVKGLWESIKYITGMAIANPKLALGFAAMNIPFVPARDSMVDILL